MGYVTEGANTVPRTHCGPLVRSHVGLSMNVPPLSMGRFRWVGSHGGDPVRRLSTTPRNPLRRERIVRMAYRSMIILCDYLT